MNRQPFLVFLLGAFILYAGFLSKVPVHLNQDELGFALNAYSVSHTGFDENGRFLPLYFWHLGQMWATPVMTYLAALVLKFLPLSEVSVRLTSVLVGVIDIVLLWMLSRRYFKSIAWAYLSAILLIITPAHLIHSRLLLDNLYPVPFVLGWLLCIQLALEKHKVKYLFLAVFILGVGVHSYHAAKITMPFYFLTTLVIVFFNFKNKLYLLPGLFAAFLAPIIPLFLWLRSYPDTIFDQVRYTKIYDPRLSLGGGLLTLISPESLVKRVEVFISYFNPDLLFLRGDNSLIHSTHLSGVFLVPFIIFIPLGIYQLFKKTSTFNKLIIFGFLTFPLAGAIAGDHNRISRNLVILPFAILIATVGTQFMWNKKKQAWKIICLILIFLSLIQFIFFYYDYLKNYLTRSYVEFRYNIPGALETTIKDQTLLGSKNIYLDNKVEFIDRYWRFYLIKHSREDLLSRTIYINPDLINYDSLQNNSLLVLSQNEISGLKKQVGNFKKINDITESDGTSRFYIFASP